MALTLWIGVIAFTLLYVYLLDRRYRLAVLEDELDEREVAAAIAAARRRRAGCPRRDRPGGGRLVRFAVELADPDYGWAYVIAGWTIVGAVVAGYATCVALRIRRAERTLPPETEQ